MFLVREENIFLFAFEWIEMLFAIFSPTINFFFYATIKEEMFP